MDAISAAVIWRAMAMVAALAIAPAPSGLATAGGGPHSARFEVDGRQFGFETPELRAAVSPAGEGVRAHRFEIASADDRLSARLVLQLPAQATDLSGDYRAVSLADPAWRGVAGVGEVVLAEASDPRRGRRLLPSGAGWIRVEPDEGGGWRVQFGILGDDLFRPADAPPVTGEMRLSVARDRPATEL